jgi:S1-C subfamily serine protease
MVQVTRGWCHAGVVRFGALVAGLIFTLALTGCGNRLKADVSPEFAGKRVLVERLGITGEGTAAAIPAFQKAGYSVVDLGSTSAIPSDQKPLATPFVAIVDKVGTDGAWWDGFFDFSMRVTETASNKIVWSATAEYGQAGLFINQTKSTDEAMTAMVTHFAKTFPPAVAAAAHPEPKPNDGSPAQVTNAGTGFFISPDGLVLTAHHVVEGARSIEIVLPGGKRYGAKLLFAQPSIDLAVLETEHRGDEFLSIPAALDSKLGDPVFTIGFPVTEILGSEPKFTEGTLSSLSGIRGDASMLQVSVPIQPGNSGGPLVNQRGEAIGVVVSAAAAGAFLRATGALPQNVNFAMRSDLCRPLLADRTIPSREPCDGRDAAIARATRATIQVVATPSSSP